MGFKQHFDCIIIKLKTNLDNKYDIILCELTSGSRDLKKVRQKFEDSGSLVVNVMKNMGEEINNISCLLLGKIKDNGQRITYKNLLNPVFIKGFKRNDIYFNVGFRKTRRLGLGTTNKRYI